MKWMPFQSEVVLSREQKSRLQVLLCVFDPTDVEAMQSAEIVYREFAHRGVQVLLDARELDAASKMQQASDLGLALTILLSAETLGHGEVEVWGPALTNRRIQLEDVVDEALAVLQEQK